MNEPYVNWENEPQEAHKNALADMLDGSPAAAASARPARLSVTAVAPAPKPRSDAERLQAACAGKAGLVSLDVEARPHPLWLRAGTEDDARAIAMLGAPRGGINIPFIPRRILEIGAGAGYRSVALALAYPQAEILATESDPGFQRVNLLNTLPYRQISSNFITLSTDQARYAFSGRKTEVGRLCLAQDDHGGITAQPLKNFLYGRNWAVLDTVVISPDAASDHLLRATWPACIRLIAVETGGEPLQPASAARFPDDQFLTVVAGNYVLLHRRHAEDNPVPARPVALFNPDGPAQSLTLTNVPLDPPGFFPLGGHGFRLHANASDAPAATLTLSHVCRQPAAVNLTLRSALRIAAPIRFSLRILSEPDGVEIFAATEVLPGGETRAISVPFAPYEGPCKLVFTTEMAGFGASNAGAWAEFLAASFI